MATEIYKPTPEEIDFQIQEIRRQKSRKYGGLRSPEEIKITDADRAYAEQRAISAHQSAIYWNFVNSEKPVKKITAEEYFNEFSKKYVVDAENEKIVKLLCLYFADDPRFERKGLSLEKGIILFGNVGCGKTTLMRFFAQNMKQKYICNPCIDVGHDFSIQGFEAIKLYSNHPRCFDDLGTDEERKHYGDKTNTMAEVILSRYDKGIMTHFTTNLDAESIREYYGDRVASRLREMCNQLKFDIKVKDRRK